MIKIGSASGEGKLDEAFAIVVDIGKTLGKVSLWSRSGKMLDRQVRANTPLCLDGIDRLDYAAIGDWVCSALSAYGGRGVRYIVPVGHGAGVVALVDGEVALPPFDYEQPLPDPMLREYRAQRPLFVETGSPPLPAGLNLGAQLFWQSREYPSEIARATLVPWAQYWAWFLSGEARSEVTSLGCHTDLWNAEVGGFSSLAKACGWDGRFAPLAAAGEVVGCLRPDLAARTGLSPSVGVLAGLHDSNAALLAARGFDAIEHADATVLSTGTWFIAMRLAQQAVRPDMLPMERDCLVNIDVRGRAVPSARFMGGREIESLIRIDTRQVDIKPDQPHLLASVPSVVEGGAMVLPTLAPGNGPFPTMQGGWRNRPRDWFAQRAGACLYGALMTDAALDLVGSKDVLLVEGRFAEAEVFVRALAGLRRDMAVLVANEHNDVSFGALRLIDPELRPAGELRPVTPLETDLTAYRSAWHAAIAQNA